MTAPAGKVVILGSGPLGRFAVGYLPEILPEYQVLGFITIDGDASGTQVADHPVLGGLDWLGVNPEVRVVLAIDLPLERTAMLQHLDSVGGHLLTLVHRSALIGPRVVVEQGAIVGPKAILTCDVTVGRAVVLGAGAMVGHDGVLGEASTIAPRVNLAGNVVVGAAAEIGTGATVMQDIRLGDRSVVGPGAVVMADVPADTTVVGVEARPRPNERGSNNETKRLKPRVDLEGGKPR